MKNEDGKITLNVEFEGKLEDINPILNEIITGKLGPNAHDNSWDNVVWSKTVG